MRGFARTVAMAVAVAGCGGGNDNGGGGDLSSASSACKSILNAELKLLMSCGAGNLFDTGAVNFQCDHLQKLVDGGSIKYDSAAASRCLAVFNTGTCDSLALSAASDVCSAVLVGTKGKGASCVSGVECLSGSCQRATPGVCPGTCTGSVALGGDCSGSGGGDTQCDRGLTCSSAGATHTCVARATSGQNCSDRDCAGGLHCIQSTCSAGATSGSCTSSNDCADTYSCFSGQCAHRKKVGEACTDGSECGSFLNCKSGVCAATTVAAAGQTCGQDAMGGYTSCGSGTFCKLSGTTNTGTCTPLIADGGACDSHQFGGQCIYGDECDSNNKCSASMCF